MKNSLFKVFAFLSITFSSFLLSVDNKIINLAQIHKANEQFDIDEDEVNSLETFKELIQKKNDDDQPYILARVETASNDAKKPFVHYFDAHELNKFNFRDYPNINRINWANYRNRNPLNNEPIKDIQYLQINRLEDPGFKYLFSLHELQSNNPYFLNYLKNNFNNVTQVFDHPDKPTDHDDDNDDDMIKQHAQQVPAQHVAHPVAPAAAPAVIAPAIAAPIANQLNNQNVQFNAELEKIRNIANRLINQKNNRAKAANKQQVDQRIRNLRRQLAGLDLNRRTARGQNFLMTNPRLILVLCDLPAQKARQLATSSDKRGFKVKRYLIDSPIAKNNPALFIRLLGILKNCGKVVISKQDLARLKNRVGNRKFIAMMNVLKKHKIVG